jgi:lipoyl synthase
MPRFSKTLQIQQQPFDKPEWLRVRYPSGENYDKIKEILRNRNLHTVCEEAHCPNIAECWGGGTATFMLLGDTCTRGCRFCMVKSGNPRGELDLFEPTKVAETVAALQLKYVVLTSVDRDDLADGGASHFSSTIKAIRQHDPKVIIEVLIPDFNGSISDIQRVVDAEPDVIAHNIETTESLTPKIRDPRATYKQSLRVLRTLKEFNPNIFTKSSIMLGLGETESDIRQTLCDLRNVQVDILTLGQYLRPSKGHVPLVEYVPPERFNYYKQVAEQLGFLYVAAGPFVRSSYRAGEFFLESLIRRNKTAS